MGCEALLCRGLCASLQDISVAVSSILSCPFTIKMRTGIADGHPNAHKLIQAIRSWGCVPVVTVSAVMVSTCVIRVSSLPCHVCVCVRVVAVAVAAACCGCCRRRRCLLVILLLSLCHGVDQVHGRSRQQRYSRRADWEYVKQCAAVAHDPVEGQAPLQV